MLPRCILFFLMLFSSAFAERGMVHADVYNRHSTPQWQWAMQATASCSWVGNERILDVGCGDGKITAALSRHVPEGLVVGLDISSDMLDYACQLHSAEDYRNLLFMQGDATTLPFPKQFDVVVSFSSLHWVVDQYSALQRMRKALIKGGTLLLLVPLRTAHNFGTLCKQLVGSEEWAGLFPSFSTPRVYLSQNEYCDLLTKAGFGSQRMIEIDSKMYFDDKNEVIGWIRPLVNFTDHLPEDLQENFLHALANLMIEHAQLLEDGTICIDNCMIAIVANAEDKNCQL